jgi:PKD repeat protein
MRFILATVLLLCQPWHITAQTCNYLAYDGFLIGADTPLHNLQGGSGWGAAWDLQGGGTVIPGYQTAGSSALTFGGLQESGSYASGGYQYQTAGRKLDLRSDGPFGPWLNSAGSIGASGKTLWMSVLLRKTENNDEKVTALWHASNIDWCSGCATSSVGVGYFGADSHVGNEKRWSLFLNGTTYPTTVAMTPNETAFFVIRVDFGSITTVSLYVNPASLGNQTPASPTLVQTTASALSLYSLALYLGNDPGSGQADEIRMGASYPCVAPDATIQVNLAPVPVFSMTPTSGQAPLPVHLDASASFDPNGTVIGYSWNFGDGSPVVTGPVVNHIFTATGILQVTLTIIDNDSVPAMLIQNVKVLDANGAFTCQNHLEALHLPACGQNNGGFTVSGGAGGVTLSLRNANGQTIAPLTGTQFGNLAPGPYTLYSIGANGCRDTARLQMVVDSSTCSGWHPDHCHMKIGTGLEGFAYYSTTRTFKDYFKNAGTWITYDPNGTAWDTQEVGSMPADPDGYPLAVPFTTPNGMRAVRGIISAVGFIPVGVPMRLLYDGSGVLTMQGTATINGSGAGYVDFTANQEGNIWFNLSKSIAADPIRNIRVVEVSDLGDYLTQPFRQNFLDKAGQFQALRFMDWMQTNGNNNVQWADRSRPGYYSQSNTPNGGVAYEYIIQLANTLNKDIWVCVPHQADDNYITQMAALFKNNLKPGIQVYLEYSNEVWNWQFIQAHWVLNNGPQNLSYPRLYAERAVHAFGLWQAVWGAEKSRVKRVLGTQAGYDWVTEEILAHAPAHSYDCISPSWYVGLDHTTSGQPNLVALGASASAADVLANANHVFESNIAHWKVVYDLAKLYGKKVVNYEGGQHFTNFTTPDYLPAMYDAQVDTGMYHLYQRMLDTLRVLGSEMPFAFVLCGPWKSKYGSWGHIFDIDDPAPWADRPKYRVLLDNMCATPPVSVRPEPAASDRKAWLYPNPAQRKLMLHLEEPGGDGFCRVQLFDVTGKLCFQSEHVGAGGFSISLAPGVYQAIIWGRDGLVLGEQRVVVMP